MAKTTFRMTQILFASKLNLNLRTQLMKRYIWGTAASWILRKQIRNNS